MNTQPGTPKVSKPTNPGKQKPASQEEKDGRNLIELITDGGEGFADNPTARVMEIR